VSVSNYYQNPGNASFRDFTPGPHSGVDPDQDHHVAPDSMDSRARTALTLGLMSLLFSVVTGLPAIWVGWKALSGINAADGAVEGRWAARTGIALGCLSVVILCATLLYLHTHA
jgi:hypothetical protein